jgi:hypothetical protein
MACRSTAVAPGATLSEALPNRTNHYSACLVTPIPVSAKPFITKEENKSAGECVQRSGAVAGASGAAARAHQGSRLRQATGTGQSHPTRGARRPLHALAVSGGQRRAEPRSFPAPRPALRAAGPLARRALRRAGGGRPAAPVPPGTVQSASSVVRSRGASGGVRPSGRARSPVRAAQSGTGFPAAGPRGAARARRSWSGRSPRGGLCGGPVVGPERQTPGELPARAHGCAGRSSAQRPSIRRQANRYRVGAPLPSGLVPSLDGRAYGPGSRVVAADRRGWHPPSSSPPASTPTAPSTARRWKSGWATASATTWLNVET